MAPQRGPSGPMAPQFEGIARGSGPGVMVMLHAAGSGPRQLDKLASLLSPLVGTAIAPRLDGDDGTLIGTKTEPFAGAIGLVRALLETRKCGRRLLFGHSMGGLIATLALADSIDVDAAIVYEPIVLSLLDPEQPDDRRARDWDRDVIDAMRERASKGDVEGGVGHFIEAYGQVPWRALPEPVRADLVRRAPQLLAAAAASNATRLDPARVRAITTPVLVLSGERSPDVTRRMADRLGALLPNATRVEIAGADHMGAATAAADVHAAIVAYLGRLGLG